LATELIHAGDLTRLGSLEEVQDGLTWLAALPHRHKSAFAQSPTQPKLSSRGAEATLT
jgi:hypothetical protein